MNKAFSQSHSISIDDSYYNLVDRLEIKSGYLKNSLNSKIKSLDRKEIIDLAKKLETDTSLSKLDKVAISYFKNDSWEYIDDSSTQNSKPFLKHFYTYKSDFYGTKTSDFDIHVSPIFHFKFGSTKNSDGATESLNTNTRGIEIRGNINNKLSFYTTFTENQVSSPYYLKSFIKANDAYPYQGFVKYSNYDTTKLRADFVYAIAYIKFNPIKNLSVQFGHDKNFIGPGIRSMILSDFSAPSLNLKISTKIGRISYTNIFSQMSNRQIPLPLNNSETIKTKFMTFHHLNLLISKSISLGFFESVVFGKRNIGFDLNYLNPVIFYRWAEGHIGSSDNALVGSDLKVNLFKTLSIYSQIVLDEFNLKENQKNGWWSKKYSYQFGLKYIDLANIDNLDITLEYNRSRPYTYSHYSTYSNYVNYNLPIAHPLGANFSEIISRLNYQVNSKLKATVYFMNATKGTDLNDLNYGGNIALVNTEKRPGDYDNFIGQGLKNKISFTDFSLSYMLRHNFFLEGNYTIRKNTTDLATSKENIYNIGIRWNIANTLLMF